MKGNLLSTLYGGILSVGFWLFGVIDLPLKILLTFVIFDYLTGICAVILTGGKRGEKLSSKEALHGLLRKLLTLVLVCFANLLSILTAYELLRNTVIMSIAIMEGISIMENLIASGMKVPPAITKHFEIMKGD